MRGAAPAAPSSTAAVAAIVRPPMTTGLPPRAVTYLQVLPLTLVLLVFLGIPLAVVVVVSFFDYDMFDIVPELTLTN